MSSNKKSAQFAGLLYLLMGIIAAYSIIYVPSKIIVRGNATATTNNILANEFLFRTDITPSKILLIRLQKAIIICYSYTFHLRIF